MADAEPGRVKARPRLLVRVDFTSASHAAEKYAEWLAEKTGGEITLLHAWQMPLIAGPKLVIYGADSPPPASISSSSAGTDARLAASHPT